MIGKRTGGQDLSLTLKKCTVLPRFLTRKENKLNWKRLIFVETPRAAGRGVLISYWLIASPRDFFISSSQWHVASPRLFGHCPICPQHYRVSTTIGGIYLRVANILQEVPTESQCLGAFLSVSRHTRGILCPFCSEQYSIFLLKNLKPTL
jgi:hypothetical protein